MSAFKSLYHLYGNQTRPSAIIHPSNNSNIYLFYDSVHLLKNIRNNLLNVRRFFFPPFQFDQFFDDIDVPGGEISWKLFHDVHEQDELIPAHLRKAPKISNETLHPGNNKQNVSLALNVFDRTTSTAVIEYFPEKKDASEFLKLINTWWTISNSKAQKNTNWRLGDAAVKGDSKPLFLRQFADWVEEWQGAAHHFTLSAQTAHALVTTLRCTAHLIDDLLEEGYSFVMTARFQTDPLERRFSKYRQMSGGRFLVSLREVQTTEKILTISSLLKEDVSFWEEDIQPDNNDSIYTRELNSELDKMSNDIDLCTPILQYLPFVERAPVLVFIMCAI